MNQTYRRTVWACYTSNLSMAVVGNLPPILFLTFRTQYGLSYSLLGLLVLINFSTQLVIDLIFSFFSHRFNIAKTVRLMPVLAVAGFLMYAASPMLFGDNVYVGLALGTVLFSSASGLGEVLISPIIAALPSDDPDREMSKLHSVYAWGAAAVVVIGTLLILTLGGEKWQLITLLFTLVPAASAVLFAGADIPKMQTPERASGALALLRNAGLWQCVLAIFLGGAAECTMAQWASGYLEMSLGLPKVWGDIFGVALFGVALGLGRTLYSKFGKNISRVLFLGALGATACYLIAALSPQPIVALAACALTGFCVSMLWPGSLIVASDRFPAGGVFIYALMAAGGDLGASVGPQLVGLITDAAARSATLTSFAAEQGLTPDQLGMKIGMLTGTVFPLVAIIVYYRIMKKKKTQL